MRWTLLTLLILGVGMLAAVTAQALPTYSVVTRLAVLEDTKPGLNSDKRARLQAIANGAGVNNAFFLASPDKVRLLSSSSFDIKETISDVKTQEFSRPVRRIYHCALVEVLTGPAAGKRGWTVVSRVTVDRFIDTYLSADAAPEEEPE